MTRTMLPSRYKGSEVLKYPEIFTPLQCKKMRIGAIGTWVLNNF